MRDVAEGVVEDEVEDGAVSVTPVREVGVGLAVLHREHEDLPEAHEGPQGAEEDLQEAHEGQQGAEEEGAASDPVQPRAEVFVIPVGEDATSLVAGHLVWHPDDRVELRAGRGLHVRVPEDEGVPQAAGRAEDTAHGKTQDVTIVGIEPSII